MFSAAIFFFATRALAPAGARGDGRPVWQCKIRFKCDRFARSVLLVPHDFDGGDLDGGDLAMDDALHGGSQMRLLYQNQPAKS